MMRLSRSQSHNIQRLQMWRKCTSISGPSLDRNMAVLIFWMLPHDAEMFIPRLGAQPPGNLSLDQAALSSGISKRAKIWNGENGILIPKIKIIGGEMLPSFAQSCNDDVPPWPLEHFIWSPSQLYMFSSRRYTATRGQQASLKQTASRRCEQWWGRTIRKRLLPSHHNSNRNPKKVFRLHNAKALCVYNSKT